jgi:hypothetical protein
VSDLAGNGDVLLEVNYLDTVRHLKSKLKKRIGYIPSIITFKDVQLLEDDKLLSDYNIGHRSTLSMR